MPAITSHFQDWNRNMRWSKGVRIGMMDQNVGGNERGSGCSPSLPEMTFSTSLTDVLLSLIQKKNVCMQCSLCTVAAQLKLEPARLLSWCSRAWWWCHCWELQTALYQCVRALCKLCKKLAGNITHMCVLMWDQKLLAQGGCVCIVVSTQMYSISCNSHFLSSVCSGMCVLFNLVYSWTKNNWES